MAHFRIDGATEPAFLSTAMLNAEYDLMQDRKGKNPNKSFENKVDPAFDPITAALRQMHDRVANEPIPDDFMRLLDQIDAKVMEQKKPS
jgi:Anti-sigma factor NepR